MSRFFLNVDVLHILAFEHKLMLSDTTKIIYFVYRECNSRDRGQGTNLGNK